MRQDKPRARRDLLLGSSCLALVAFGSATAARASLTVNPNHGHWRFCRKCFVLFQSDERYQLCAAGDTHQADGATFEVPYMGRDTPTSQAKWFACQYCAAMSYAGFPTRGRCPVGAKDKSDRGHEPDKTFSYQVPHDTTLPGRSTANWRFCNKCMAMFFDGLPAKGTCAAGGGHVAQGFSFVIPVRS